MMLIIGDFLFTPKFSIGYKDVSVLLGVFSYKETLMVTDHSPLTGNM